MMDKVEEAMTYIETTNKTQEKAPSTPTHLATEPNKHYHIMQMFIILILTTKQNRQRQMISRKVQSKQMGLQ